MPRRQQDHHKRPDLADHYSQIGIDAVAASVRYEGGRHIVDLDRPSSSGTKRQTRSQAGQDIDPSSDRG